MRRKLLGSALVAALATVLLAGSATAAPSAQPGGYHAHLIQARAFYVYNDPFNECYQYYLYTGINVGTNATLGPGSRPTPFAVAWVDRTWVDVCRSETLLDMYGETPMAEGDYTVDGLRSASVHGITVEAYGAGYTQFYTLDLTWTGNGDISPWIVLDGTLMPSPGSPPGLGANWMEHYVTAGLEGTIGSTGWTLWVCEIGELVTVSPPRP